ncbi:MAG: hypothetical protein KKD38_02040 [Candidatus Delongbacteria bacterium]|nr:hypothetical protein [Candidatus Delongbacteria bacterium]
MKNDRENIEIKQFKKIDILGFFMVVSPLISSLLLWYWFYYIETLNEMTIYFFTIVVCTIFFTAVLATIDSHRLGIKVNIYGNKEIYGGNFLKFFIFLLLWIYTYPVYLYRRKNYGGRNLLYPLIFSLFIFIASSLYLYYALEIKYEQDGAYQKRKLHQRNLR